MERPLPTPDKQQRELFSAYIAQEASIHGIILDEAVQAVFERVDRRNFVPASYISQVMENTAIPLPEYESTISQPSLMAIMLQLAEFSGAERALEIGTASGLNAAYMSHLAQEVHTIEYNGHLVARARENLAREGRENVTVHHGDGLKGLPASAPFDRIIVTAGARDFPLSLVAQLSPKGRMIIPVGPDDPYSQTLYTIINMSEGPMVAEHGPVDFVPLISPEQGGWSQEALEAVKK